MPDPSTRGLLSDIELVEYAQQEASRKNRSLRKVKDDTLRDAKVVQDRATGEQITVPNKFILSIGIKFCFRTNEGRIFLPSTGNKLNNQTGNITTTQ